MAGARVTSPVGDATKALKPQNPTGVGGGIDRRWMCPAAGFGTMPAWC
jgi:hypothetical protein